MMKIDPRIANSRRLSTGRIDNLVVARLRMVDIMLRQAIDQVATMEGLREGLVTALALIVTNPGLSQNDISRQLGMDKAGIFQIVNQLEERGWALRTKSSIDKRRHELQPTEAGIAYLNELVDRIEAREAVLLSSVPASDLPVLYEILERMHHSCIEHE